MKRFTLGEYALAGWEVWDGRNMSVGYFDAKTEEGAQAYVDYRNLIENIRLQQLRDEARAKVEFYATLERINNRAA